MKKEIEKKEENGISKEAINSILGGRVKSGVNFKTGELINTTDGDRDYKKEIEKVSEGDRVKEVEYTNPFTGNKTIQVIDRRGTTDEKLAMVLSSKDSTDEQKLSALSLYLFEKGKESASFITDLFLYKGTHTKEMRQFKTQLKFDFDSFVNMFTNFLFESSQSIIDVILPNVDIVKLEEDAYTYLKDNEEKELSIKDFVKKKYYETCLNESNLALIVLALKQVSEAQTLRNSIREKSEERERERGKGIHIDKERKVTR